MPSELPLLSYSMLQEIIAVPEGSTSCLESDGSNISQGKAVVKLRRNPKTRNSKGDGRWKCTKRNCFDSFSNVMKPPLSPSMSDGDVKDRKMKKKVKAVENDNNMEGQAHFDNNFMFEVLKHVDAWTLVMSGCLNK
ncbi:hypothetical protein JHK87_044305 [Glycine soja]|nr:hypothetical protein JHK87_044305 [Glycine soja]